MNKMNDDYTANAGSVKDLTSHRNNKLKLRIKKEYKKIKIKNKNKNNNNNKIDHLVCCSGYE